MNEKKRKNNKRFLIEIFLVVITILLLWTAQHEVIISLWMVILVFICFVLEYHPREWILFAMGIIFGIIIEIGGGIMYKLQYWQSGMFFGIPLWLPIAWGFVFMFVRRLGNFIVND